MIERNKDACTWAMLCHLSALVALVGVPLGHILGPLVIWLIKRNDHPFVDDQGKESLNFQISMSIYGIVLIIIIVAMIGSMAFFWPFHGGFWFHLWNPMAIPFNILISILLVMGLFLLDLILVVVATIKASSGEPYRYPFTIKFLR